MLIFLTPGALSSSGRAPRLQRGGDRFDPGRVQGVRKIGSQPEADPPRAENPLGSKNMRLILGSQSSARQRLLKTMGYSFSVMNPDIDEKSIRSDDPKQLTLQLANAKADALLQKISEPSLLITADLVVVCNGQIYEKPETVDEAREHFKSYATSPAQTITSIVVTNTTTNQRVHGTDVATIFFKSIPNEIIDALIATGDPFTQAGSFNIEHPLLKPYVDRIEGEYQSAMGLPVKLTQRLLETAQH